MNTSTIKLDKKNVETSYQYRTDPGGNDCAPPWKTLIDHKINGIKADNYLISHFSDISSGYVKELLLELKEQQGEKPSLGCFENYHLREWFFLNIPRILKRVSKTYVFLLPSKNTARIRRIKDILKEHEQLLLEDKKQIEEQIEKGKIPVYIEVDIPAAATENGIVVNATMIVDNGRRYELGSLLYVLRLLGIEPTRYDLLVSEQQRHNVPELLRMVCPLDGERYTLSEIEGIMG